jgi:hypothetical protein
MTMKAKWLFLLVLIASNVATGLVVQKIARPKDDRQRDMVNALARMGSVNGPFVVILGDSITQNARLPDTVCGMPLINAGTGGSRTSTYIPFAEEMRAHKISPSLVVIALGTNDAISGYGADFIPAYELLIRSLPAGSLAFATPPPVDGPSAGILNMTALQSIDLAIKEIAASQKSNPDRPRKDCRPGNEGRDSSEEDGLSSVDQGYCRRDRKRDAVRERKT